jgi:sec-independent protein translocase protein TatA
MGLGGISIWQLLILAVIVIAVFGTKKFKSMGEDLGGAIQGFKKAMSEGKDEAAKEQDKLAANKSQTVDVKAEKVEADR